MKPNRYPDKRSAENSEEIIFYSYNKIHVYFKEIMKTLINVINI